MRDEVAKYAVDGGNSTLDSLAEHLDEMAAPSASYPDLVITRTFNAPRALVWKAHSGAERLAQWWGPRGMAIQVADLDFRPGGRFLYRLDGANGLTMWGKFEYREIQPQERLVYYSSFSDEQGNTTRAPFPGNFPLQVLNILILTEQEGKTMLILHGGPHNASAVEQAFFAGMHDSMQQGFGGTMEPLEEYLARA